MQHSHVLRATACVACLLIGGAACAQGAGGALGARADSLKFGGFTPIALHGHGFGRMGGGVGGIGGVHAFNAGRMGGNFNAAHNFNTARAFNGAHDWHGRHGHGYGGYGGEYAYGWGYPYDYGYYPYDDYGYDYGPYAQGEYGSYCQTPVTSCGLSYPSVVGAACQCRNGIDQEPGTVQP